ncbi:MAG: glycosyltransferase family 39 protein [Thermodesulfobacteriota bacterium]
MSPNFREAKFKRDALIILGFILITTIPFINKPFHIDDPYFIAVGENILHHPLQPFYGKVALYGQDFLTFEKIGKDPNTFESMSHPPLLPYFIAIVAFITGSITERSLHIFYMLFTTLAALSAYLLSNRFTRHPLICTFLLISSPIFVLSSHSIMTDMVMLAFYLSGMYSFIYGIDNDNKKILLLSGVFIGLAILTRYVALTLIPLLFAYSILNKRSLIKTLFPFFISALLLGVWSFQNLIYYGELHFIASSRFFAKYYENFSFGFNDLFKKAISDLSSIGGSAVFPFVWLVFISRRKIIIYSLSVLFSLYVLIINPLDIEAFRYYSNLQLILFICFFSTGLFITYNVFEVGIKPFIISLSKSSSLERRNIIYKDTDNIFLFLWFGGILASSIIILPFGSARYMLPPLLPIVIILINRAEKVFNKNVRYFQIFCTSVITLTLMMGFSLAYGDYIYADAYRSFVKSLKGKIDNNRIWFIGEWGFRYYMEKEGYSNLLSNNDSPKEGDIIIKPRIAGLHDMSTELISRVELIDSVEYGSNFPFKLLNPEAKAGFYAHGFGFLPFSFSTAELEHFDIFKVGSPNFLIKNLNKAIIETLQKELVTPLILNINGDSRATLFEHPPSKITYKLTIPEKAFLSFGIALDPKTWSPDKGDGVLFEIYVQDGSISERVFSKYIDPKNKSEDRKWHDEVVDLSKYGGNEVSLSFVTKPGPNNNTDYDWAGWSNPKLIPVN